MKKYTEIKVGDKAELIHIITQFDINKFVDLTGDNNKLHLDENSRFSVIDSFLTSCRIIGRNAEYAFFNSIVNMLKEKRISVFKSKYIKTSKNEQVKEFYYKCLFNLLIEEDLTKDYALDINNYSTKKINYIEVIND